MKYLKISFLLWLVMAIAAFQCEDMAPNELVDCIDPNDKYKDLACLMIYDPVCGCDQKTYGNSCEAQRAGVKSYTKGACE
ncbi:Kazal-type serine protease inhibitor family protein [Belliella sp. DSM 111904]|uniref:Kazal-type serine protease inhibitor family protein n=1 Tax=Belliella filtrata TaxID=2923435 RepID=A0ABS9V2C2_9BACT|nr:Kazal-type serine protease inhibitor family protein [Belliella filtrata]MCH7410123.1 Kazal-type serine protease inhibitor family protein [Belliella filtrata]